MATSSSGGCPTSRGMTGEQYRRYPNELTMGQVTVDARDRENRAGVFKVVTTTPAPRSTAGRSEPLMSKVVG